jgi:hypothetical protein
VSGSSRLLCRSAESKWDDAQEESMMAAEPTMRDDILHTILSRPGCLLEELIFACPQATWNQVFLEIDHLSRTGQVRLSLEGPGLYRVSQV